MYSLQHLHTLSRQPGTIGTGGVRPLSVRQVSMKRLYGACVQEIHSEIMNLPIASNTFNQYESDLGMT